MSMQKQPSRSLLTLDIWIPWAAITLAGAVTLTSFVFTTFQTKTDADEVKVDLERRLERMENKIDTIVIRTSK